MPTYICANFFLHQVFPLFFSINFPLLFQGFPRHFSDNFPSFPRHFLRQFLSNFSAHFRCPFSLPPRPFVSSSASVFVPVLFAHSVAHIIINIFNGIGTEAAARSQWQKKVGQNNGSGWDSGAGMAGTAKFGTKVHVQSKKCHAHIFLLIFFCPYFSYRSQKCRICIGTFMSPCLEIFPINNHENMGNCTNVRM
jgi:hypothetical protein